MSSQKSNKISAGLKISQLCVSFTSCQGPGWMQTGSVLFSLKYFLSFRENQRFRFDLRPKFRDPQLGQWKATIFIRFARRNYRAQKSCDMSNLLQNSFSLNHKAQFQKYPINLIISRWTKPECSLALWVSRWGKKKCLLTMCHTSKF